MIIDAWMQHPNAEWIGNPMFDSLRLSRASRSLHWHRVCRSLSADGWSA
jgi:hypothetical protein